MFSTWAAVTYIDSSAVQALKDLYQEYKLRDIQVVLTSFLSPQHKQSLNYFSTNHLVHIQIAISNPNRDVLLTFSRSGVVELIGKEWFFVRVHDAVQVCLQHVESLNETTKTSDSSPKDKSSFLQSLVKSRSEDFSVSQLESGFQKLPSFNEIDPQLEPLLSRKPWKLFGHLSLYIYIYIECIIAYDFDYFVKVVHMYALIKPLTSYM